MPCSLIAGIAVSDTGTRPEANGSTQPEQLEKDIAMYTLFDDIATSVVTCAFAIASASGFVAMVAGAV